MNPAAEPVIRIGMLTPSSNTVLEPVTARMLHAVPGVTAHFARFRVTEIGMGSASQAQFDLSPMLAAAQLLADARCSAICWGGTSAGWLGAERDRELCAAIEARTGIRATSAVLSLLQAFRAANVGRYALVTPYVREVQEAVIAQLDKAGFECTAERHGGRSVNFEFSQIGRDEIAAMMRAVAKPKPDAIVVLCTNMDGASLAETIESECGTLVLDSIAVALWGTMHICGADRARLAGWGRLFRELG